MSPNQILAANLTEFNETVQDRKLEPASQM